MHALLGLYVLAIGQAPPVESRPLTVQLSFSKQAVAEPFTGRVFLLASRSAIDGAPPRQSWFKPFPFFAQDVRDWRPDEPLTFRPQHAFPVTLDKLPAEKFYLQAVLDRDQGGQSSLNAPGNVYSKAIVLDPKAPPTGPLTFVLDRVVPERRFAETERVKLVEMDSKFLSKFHGKPMKLRAGVVLPKSFATDADRKYPVIYEIPGFGGDHFGATGAAKRNVTDVAGVEMLHVTLDPACRLGHHVFADSDNNGPCGQALVEELIPLIEAKYRGLGKPAGRFVTGHSSGGWSSLWLQVTYPRFFGGVWSTSPDPVDFRDFQRVDVYTPRTNIFTDVKGADRPLARKDGKALLYYKPFSDMEVVMGRGGQLFSFEAVFGPKGPGGQPRPLWDRKTGLIDPEVAASWRRYDIRLIMEQNWPKLAPQLAGKLHVYMGAEDTFYLEGATRLLGESLKKLGSDAVVEIVPGRDHSTLLNTEMRQRIAREMAEKFNHENTKGRKHEKNNP
jgi:S-formylglutathione hydrolase FrmB